MSLEISKEKFTHTIDKDISRDKAISEAPEVLGFGVFYGDGSSYFGRTEEDWMRAPKEDVQIVLLYYDKYDVKGNHYRHTICGWDYYAFDGAKYEASNDTRNLSTRNILYGRWMDTEKWREVVNKALDIEYKFKNIRR